MKSEKTQNGAGQRKERRKFSLKARISAVYVAIILVLNFFTGMVISQYFQNTVQLSITSSMRAAMHSDAVKAEQFLQKVNTAIGLICNEDRYLKDDVYATPSIFQIVNRYSQQMNTEERMAFARDLAVNRALFGDYLQICLGDPEDDYACVLYIDQQYPISNLMSGSRFHKVLTNQKGFFNPAAIQGEDWYRKTVKLQGEAYWFRQEEPDRICMAKLLKYRYIDEDNTLVVKDLGVIALSFPISRLWERPEEQQQEPALVLLTGTGDQALYSSLEALEGKQLAAGFEDDGGQDFQSAEIDGVAYYGQKAKLPLGLTFVELLPTGNIHRETGKTVWAVYLFTFGISVIGILFVYWTSGILAKPIRTLASHMEQTVSEPISCERVRNDEVGQLYRSFNRMIQRVNGLISDLRSSYGARRTAELRALQMQINPHFVYNTLDSVCCLSLMRGDDDLADILSALTQIMRYNTRNPDELVPLQAELDVIAKYEQIQKNRYQDSLNIRYSIDESTAGLLIPKLIIQPLVENAILYGMQEDGRVMVHVKSFRQEDSLVIQVADEGSSADLEEINRQAAGGEPGSSSGGIGIRNVAVRLQMIYGDKASLHYRSRGEEGQEDEKGTIAELRFPVLEK